MNDNTSLLITVRHSEKGLVTTLTAPRDGNLPGVLKAARCLVGAFTEVYGGACRIKVKA